MNPIIRTYQGRNVPAPMTNSERLAVFRALSSRMDFNSYPWKFRQ